MVYSSDSVTFYPHPGDVQLYIKGTLPEHFIFAVHFYLFVSVTVEIALAEDEKSQILKET